MTVLIAYATTEGHTRTIAKAIENQLGSLGYGVVVVDTATPRPFVDLAAISHVIVAGSVHERSHQKSLQVFVAAHQSELEQHPTLFLSISLAAASPDNQSEADDYIDIFCRQVDWTPAQVLKVGGALRYSEYDYFTSQTVQYNVPAYGALDPSSEDQVFTDWPRLFETVESFVRKTTGSPGPGH